MNCNSIPAPAVGAARKYWATSLIRQPTTTPASCRPKSAPPKPLMVQPYDQEAWVRLAGYQHLPVPELLALWTGYNRLILHLLAQIPKSALATECFTLNLNSVTLYWLIDDYVLHLEHHVRQIMHNE